MKRSLFILCGMGWMASCGMDAAVVRMPAETDLAGAAGQSMATGGASGAAGGTYVPPPNAGSSVDWCMPPPYDPTLAPRDKNCGLSPYASLGTSRPWTAVVLLDRSMSMSGELGNSGMSKWVAIHEAISRMGSEPNEYLDEWSLLPFAQDDTFSTLVNCGASSYVRPAPLVQARPQESMRDVSLVPPTLDVKGILSAFESLRPSALMRPTASALQAAIQHAQDGAARYAGTSTPIVILITDGLPYGCSSAGELDALVQVAQDANLPTAHNVTPIHVIQLGDGYDLSAVAAVGSMSTYNVVTGKDVVRQLVNVFRRIFYRGFSNCANWVGIARNDFMGAAAPDFEITMTNAYSRSLLAPPRLSSADECASNPAGGFWVTDAGTNQPYVVGLCPCTCAAMGADRLTTLRLYCKN